MAPADDSERITKLRALIEAEDKNASGAPAPSSREPVGATPNRTPLLITVGAGVAIAVVVAVLLVLGDSDVEQPDGTTQKAVSFLSGRVVRNVEEGEAVTICHRKEGLLADGLVVAGIGTEEAPLLGKTVVLDLYIPDDQLSRFAGKATADLEVVRGTCGTTSPPGSVTASTAPPVPEAPPPPPDDPTLPTQPPDSQPATPPPRG